MDRSLIHFEGEEGDLTRTTEKSFQTFLNYCKQWLSLDGEQNKIAVSTLASIDERIVEASNFLEEPAAEYYYHRNCYSKFTNKTLVNRAESRCKTKRKIDLADHGSQLSVVCDEPVRKTKLLRSSAPSVVNPQKKHVLAPRCIICKQEKSYYTDSKMKTRKLDKMVSAETLDGGQLTEAAKRKNDQEILIQIEGKDYVALELKYHKRCYSSYTSFLRHERQDPESLPLASRLFAKSFDKFCQQVIQNNIIEKGKIYYMKTLKEKFVKTVEEMEDCSASSYRTFRLKERLIRKFPQLVFHTPRKRNKSEIVYAEDLRKGSVAESYLEEREEGVLTDIDSQDEGTETVEQGANFQRNASLREIYSVALTLRECAINQQAKWYDQWPPLSSDMTQNNVKKVVPPILFNFIAWMLGLSTNSEEFVHVDVDEKVSFKLFSVCQDLIYIASRGKYQTPKSLALAAAVRQISGCSGLITLLNGLGHSVSLPSTMSLDTALAQLAIDTTTIIPREIVTGKFVNLVYDNIDFGEEVVKQTRDKWDNHTEDDRERSQNT
eukprot:gene12432-13717_t